MWFIEGQITRRGRTVDVRTWLKPGTTLTLGRQDNDPNVLCVGTDVNVSRRHVALTVSESTLADVTIRNVPTSLTVRDLSQNGVFLDGKRIPRQEDTPVQLNTIQPRRLGTWISSSTSVYTQLEAEDQEGRSTVAGHGYGGSIEMTIGNMKFRLERVDFSVTFAGMSSSEKVEVSQLAADMDIKIEPKEWASGVSTHLLMSSSSSPRAEQLRLSDKVYQTLAQGGHIITTPWLKAFRDSLEASVKNRYELFDPPPEFNYLPTDFESLAEVSGINWSPNFKRKSLFDHHLFVFLSNDAKASKWEACIQSASGVVVKEEPNAVTAIIRRCLTLDKKEPVFLRPINEEDFTRISSSVEPILKKMRYRWVETREIGMAILAVSTEQFCNPKYQGALPTLDDQLTNVSMSTLSTLDLRQSMRPLPEGPTSILSPGTRAARLHRDETVMVKDTEHLALFPSLDFDDFITPRREKTSRANSSSAQATAVPSAPTPVQPPPPPTTRVQPTPATAAPSPKSYTNVRDTGKKKRALDMFLDDDDDVIIVDPAPRALKTPTPVSLQDRIPTVTNQEKASTTSPRLTEFGALSPAASTTSTPSSSTATKVIQESAKMDETSAAVSDRPIMLDSDDDLLDFTRPLKRSRMKKDSKGSGDGDGDGAGTKGSPAMASSATFTAAKSPITTHSRKEDGRKAESTTFVKDGREEDDMVGKKIPLTADPKSGKRRKILMSDSTSQETWPSDIFDDLADMAVEDESRKPSELSSSSISPTSKKESGRRTSSGSRKKMDSVQHDVSLYHIEDMIHHQSEIQKYERQEAELQQRRKFEQLEREYERATSLRPESTASGSSNDAAMATKASKLPSKKQQTALMTSVFSDRLLAKDKRRKLLPDGSVIKIEEEEETGIGATSTDTASQRAAQSSLSSSMRRHISNIGEQVASLSLQGDEERHLPYDWPERWKTMPNFKMRPPVDPVIVEKWKGRPNFKAFRRTTMPGIPMTNRPPVTLKASQQ